VAAGPDSVLILDRGSSAQFPQPVGSGRVTGMEPAADARLPWFADAACGRNAAAARCALPSQDADTQVPTAAGWKEPTMWTNAPRAARG
jgi:hypothetical protein